MIFPLRFLKKYWVVSPWICWGSKNVGILCPHLLYSDSNDFHWSDFPDVRYSAGSVLPLWGRREVRQFWLVQILPSASFRQIHLVHCRWVQRSRSTEMCILKWKNKQTMNLLVYLIWNFTSGLCWAASVYLVTLFLCWWLTSTKCRATENRFFAGLDPFLVCKTDSFCIKRIFFGPKKHTLLIIYWPNYLD